MIDLDEIRKEVAIKNGILLDKEDPQLTMVTINQMLLEKAVATLHAQNIEHQKKTVEAVVAVMAESLAKEKETAGRVITEGSDYVSKRLESTFSDIEDRFFKSAMNYLKAMDSQRHDAIAAKKTALLAMGISGVFAVIAAWAVLSTVLH